MFAVTEFINSLDEEGSNEISIVPISWLVKKDEKCYWPNRIGKHVDNTFVRQNPTPKTTWMTYKVKKVHFKTESYSIADTFLENLLTDSKSEAEQTGSSCSVIKKKFTQDAIKNVEDDTSSEDPTIYSNIQVNTYTRSISGNAHECCSAEIIELVESINFLKVNIAKVVAHTEQQSVMLAEVLRNSRTNLQECSLIKTPRDTPNFPLGDLDIFNDVNKRLEIDPIFYQYMVQRLSALGGSAVEGLTGRILTFLLTDQFAQGFNWKVHNNKMAFEKTNLMKIICEAAIKHFPDGEKNILAVENVTTG